MANVVAEETFLTSYIETALWASTDESDNPLDGLGVDLAEDTHERMSKDCAAFCVAVKGLIDPFSTDYPVAHDFWLTRNHHGAGFWDGDYPKELGDRLTEIAHGFGECSLYVGDDEKVYIF